VLRFVRIWLPVITTLAGVVVIIAGDFDEIALEGGAGIIGAGLSIWLMNLLFRVGLGNDKDRDAEDAARDFYDAHGHWPDEPPPPPRPSRAAPAPPAAGPQEHRLPRDRIQRPPRPPRRPG
jgi:hypothetical protein